MLESKFLVSLHFQKMSQCAACGVVCTPDQLLQCNGCRSALYCSKAYVFHEATTLSPFPLFPIFIAINIIYLPMHTPLHSTYGPAT